MSSAVQEKDFRRSGNRRRKKKINRGATMSGRCTTKGVRGRGK